MRFVVYYALLGILWGILAPGASALTVRPQNIVDLLEDSDRILAGRVADIRDGFDDGVPFTEISVEVEESFGLGLSTYTFRRFGLLESRRMPDGRMNHNVSPDGMSRYTVGERVLLFMNPPARRTGLTSTVGLFYGKFTFSENGTVTNDIGNAGLFDGVSFEGDARTFDSLRSGGSRLSGAQLLEFIRRAVSEDWVAKGVVSDAR